VTKRIAITRNKLPDSVCPDCGAQVLKVTLRGALSYECCALPNCHTGPWDSATKKEQRK